MLSLTSLGDDSFSIIFNHRSSQKLAVFPGFLVAFWKEGSLETMGEVPREQGDSALCRKI